MLLKKIEQYIAFHTLIPEDSSIVVGLSGGPDSVFLLYFLHHLRTKGDVKTIIAAHLDHEWRVESHKDVEFCKELAQKLDIPFISAKLSELGIAIKSTGSKEELGRHARRFFFQHVKNTYNANLIALGHHLQDQEETFFIRLIRGTSLSGLCAMWPKSGDYIRPLLEINKDEIVAYLEEHTIPYVTDPSNESPEFLRNRIRNTVITPLRTVDNRFDKNFLVTLSRLQETELYLQHLTQEVFTGIARKIDNRYEINITHFLNVDTFLQNRILLHWLIVEKVPFAVTQSFLDEILRFLKSPGSKEHAIHEKWKIIKDKTFYIQKN